MTARDDKFGIDDLYIGMEIRDKNQLSDIYDTWILLVKTRIPEPIRYNLSARKQMPNLIDYSLRETSYVLSIMTAWN